MSTDTLAALARNFGFEAFRPGQEKVIEALLAGRSALAVFPTGGGKSLCYQLPALEIEGLTVVVSPLIALMKDQIDFLKKRGIPAARLDSTLTSAEAGGVSEAIRNGDLKLLYVAPERFNNERFLAEMKRTKIGLFAIDEAHCISEWGHNFRPDYLKLAETALDIGAERILALTATATPSVVGDICRSFRIDESDAIVTGFYRKNLTLLTTQTNQNERDAKLSTRLKEMPPGPAIVYVTLQKTAEAVAEMLSKQRLPARAYHAGMDSEVRNQVQDWWMAQSDGIVVATIAFGMGIDKANVRYVYHYNLPKSLESYSQEIGRAGRDDKPSTVELFACADDIPVLENFAYGDTPSPESVRTLVCEAFSWPMDEPTAVSPFELSQRLDMRLLVLRTALTYLELMGLIRAGTPIYAGYEMKPLVPLESIFGQFPGQHGDFVRRIFAFAKQGRTWFSLNPDDAARALGVERRRVVRAMDVMENQGLVEVRASEVQTPYRRLANSLDPNKVAAELIQRFDRREQQEIERIKRVVELVEHEGCQVNALVGYFGEGREKPCGHCTVCLTKTKQSLPPPSTRAIDLSESEVADLLQKCTPELRDPRQLAKILCGLSSPSFTKLKLTKEKLYGALDQHRFADVVAWCESFSCVSS